MGNQWVAGSVPRRDECVGERRLTRRAREVRPLSCWAAKIGLRVGAAMVGLLLAGVAQAQVNQGNVEGKPTVSSEAKPK